MMRQVVDGERLSGHGTQESGYPEILIFDGIGVKDGSLICSIQSFHTANVVVKGTTTELWFEWFESRLCLVIPDGIVKYAE
jgi:hypothetical protein